MSGKAGSIFICVGELPAQVSRQDLKAYVRQGIDEVRRRSANPSRIDALLARARITSAITDHVILRLTNQATGAVSHQGLVAIQPAKLGLDVIKLLVDIPLQGQTVKICRYRHSSFDVRGSARAKSLSELLGTNPIGNLANTPSFRLELVETTGSISAPAHMPKATGVVRTGTRGVFA